MKYYAVSSGNILACVRAKSVEDACIQAMSHKIVDDPPCIPGQLFEVAEIGQSYDEHMFIAAKAIGKAGGFKTRPVKEQP